jgi:hypothetical protein
MPNSTDEYRTLHWTQQLALAFINQQSYNRFAYNTLVVCVCVFGGAYSVGTAVDSFAHAH